MSSGFLDGRKVSYRKEKENLSEHFSFSPHKSQEQPGQIPLRASLCFTFPWIYTLGSLTWNKYGVVNIWFKFNTCTTFAKENRFPTSKIGGKPIWRRTRENPFILDRHLNPLIAGCSLLYMERKKSNIKRKSKRAYFVNLNITIVLLKKLLDLNCVCMYLLKGHKHYNNHKNRALCQKDFFICVLS